MTLNPDDLLDTLSCEIDARPAGAPTLDDVLPFVRDVRRSGPALIIDFEPGAQPVVEGFAAAERLCCTGIRWDVTGSPVHQLRIAALPGQLDALASLFSEERRE